MEEFESTSQPETGINVSSHREQSESLISKHQEQSSKDKTVFVIPNDTDKNVPEGWNRKQNKVTQISPEKKMITTVEAI